MNRLSWFFVPTHHKTWYTTIEKIDILAAKSATNDRAESSVA